ncbi:hypothetical protein BpHYR1_031376 [Brachionus plicatilis]|uniref:Uncharacterized protein n=1 Tax=Brachionus plicatilis TaxID=10195 RepID=A0A3M7STW5_BRAPC|nr:hypothetical protein BpHYR1_031376 [Brachionus plicatilis]
MRQVRVWSSVSLRHLKCIRGGNGAAYKFYEIFWCFHGVSKFFYAEKYFIFKYVRDHAMKAFIFYVSFCSKIPKQSKGINCIQIYNQLPEAKKNQKR